MRKNIKKLKDKDDYLKAEGKKSNSVELSINILNNTYQKDLSAWDKVKLARDRQRPTAIDYIHSIFDGFIELHGDRYYGDDKAIVGGLGFLKGIPVTIIGVQKGQETKENIERNFGMPHPEGYRKAMRLMKQANKFKRPIITFIDTPGAYPGFGAEERGQGQAIASSLVTMMELEVPIISIIIGEGGSGGALALGVANQVWMLENAIYSILTPEGFASILYKDASLAKEAAEKMKITSEDLLRMRIIDLVISEDNDNKDIMSDIKNNLYYELTRMRAVSGTRLQRQRYDRFRRFI